MSNFKPKQSFNLNTPLMSQNIAYIRTSTSKQDTDNQKLQIFEYAHQQNIHIDEILFIQISSGKSLIQRRINELMEKLDAGDTLIVTEISRLGRSTSEVIQLINTLLNSQIRIIALKQGIDIRQNDMSSKIIITLFSLLAELERDLISLRTKEALAVKKRNGVVLGKPKGTIQKSKFDKDITRIKELLSLGVSIRRISTILGYSNAVGLTKYIKSRNIKDQIVKQYV